MFKWVAGLCAAMYLTLLIFGAPPEGDQTAALDLGFADTAVEADVEPVAEPVARPPEPAVVEPVVEAPAPDVAEEALPAVAPLTTTPITSAVLDGDKVVAPETPRETVTLTVAEPAPAVTPQPVLAEQAPEAAPSQGVGEIWTVTGSRVNLRAGATTQASVVGQTRRGESAEVMELLENGWARVYILESGIEAYMSADFISRDG